MGAKSELESAATKMDDAQIHDVLLDRGCDWFKFKMNPPAASYMGGVWERQICSIHNVLCALLQGSGQQLDDELPGTFICEADEIVNRRQLD